MVCQVGLQAGFQPLFQRAAQRVVPADKLSKLNEVGLSALDKFGLSILTKFGLSTLEKIWLINTNNFGLSKLD